MRIAAGSGTKVEDVNKLLKMHRNMADVMKMMGSGAKRGPMAGLAKMLGMGGGMPSPEQMAELAKKMPGGLPPGACRGAPGLPHTARNAGHAEDARRQPDASRPWRQTAGPRRLPGIREEEMTRHASGFAHAE